MSAKNEAIKSIGKTEYTADGVRYKDFIQLGSQASKTRVIKTQPAPRIYVNDGSLGTNLVYAESYKNYTDSQYTPRVTNSYTNNFPRFETKNTVYNSEDGTKLHKYGESGGYSDYVTIRTHK